MKVLFVGNSTLYYAPGGNDALSVAGQFQKLAELGGHSVTLTGTYIGGGSLGDHWTDTKGINAQDELAKGTYDVAMFNGSLDETNFGTYADRFADLARAEGTDVMFYGLWPGDYEISISGGDTSLADRTAGYKAAAVRNDAGFVPNAYTYAEVYKELTRLYGDGDDGQTAENMLTVDAIHATSLGGYAMANTLYEMFFGETAPSASSWRPAGVSLGDAKMVQAIVHSVAPKYGIELDGAGGGGGGAGGGGGGSTGTGTISGQYFTDANGGGTDSSDAGLAGATVRLIEDGAVVATTTTSGSGTYSFGKLDAGSYIVEFAAPKSNMKFTAANAGTNDAVDSDVTTTTGTGAGRTATIKIGTGATATHVDAGVTAVPNSVAPGDSPKDYDHMIKGTNAADRLAGSATDDYITGAAANDRLDGARGIDYLDGGTGRDTLDGGNGGDRLVFDAGDGLIAGGTGTDTLIFRSDASLTSAAVNLTSIERIELGKAADVLLRMDVADLGMSGDVALRFIGDGDDTLRLSGPGTLVRDGTTTIGGEQYDRYHIGSHDFAIDADVALYVNNALIV